ncbi:MAG: PASTA domain-containing protein [Bacteroidales bacterium]|nr:PASTA domain-containing protein [Bacteroidales bacterium]
MAKKDNFWNKTLFGLLLRNLVIAGLILIVLAGGMLLFLNFYTNHGKSETVPDLRGFTIEEATAMLNRHNLKYEIIDSSYVRNKKLGTILEQNPAPSTSVKPGRPIYLIINSRAVRQIPLPNLRDISLRQAQAMAKSLGVNIAKVVYAPSEYKDLVLDVKYKNQPLLPGSKVPEGGSIVLVAGDGIGLPPSGVAPSLTGLDLVSATRLLSAMSLTLGGIIYDVPPEEDEDSYIIYSQNPVAGDSIATGAIVDVWLSKTPVEAKEEFVQPQPQQPRKEIKKEREKVKDIEEFF